MNKVYYVQWIENEEGIASYPGYVIYTKLDDCIKDSLERCKNQNEENYFGPRYPLGYHEGEYEALEEDIKKYLEDIVKENKDKVVHAFTKPNYIPRFSSTFKLINK